ncbi:MAG: M14 family zinc carboxypeptidase [Pseudomonas sp.]|uniref:M14 family zinc carboxypeptidase n=1 Tax=Pseudomonas sp. TaxID=306 RepID=UPI002734EAD0|nr:M14 family zinc carboxypeptidase [Pseudomonas sp.]MDP3845633.1 M14 family zinc carboxypeptidase [Pseudomonas sp.]
MKIALHTLSALALLVAGVNANLAFAAPNAPQDDFLLMEQEKADNQIYKAFFPNKEIARKAAISFHAQMLESHYEDGYLVMELNDEEMQKLQPFGFTFAPATEFIEKRNQVLSTMQNRLQMKSMASSDSTSSAAAASGIPGYSCYATVEETFAEAAGMASSKPNLAQWLDVGNSWEKSSSLGGYDMRVLKLTNTAKTGNKPKLFINSAIHAREYTTAALTLDFARWLINGYGENADATWILDNHEVHILLMANPDGRKKAEAGLSWRKNANQSYCGATSNSRGADLNRNFTFGWNSTNGQGSSDSQCNDTYRGPSAGSEPEIQALENYVRSLWPDRRGPTPNDAAPSDTSGIHLDIHSYSELVLWPWGDTSNLAPNASALQTLGRKFAFFNNYTPQQSIGLYPTDGTSDGISYGELGVPAYTFELGTQFFQSCTTYNNTIKPNNLPALIYAAKVVRTPYTTPAGPDITAISLSGSAATTGVPAGAAVTLSGTLSDVRFNNSNGSESTQAISAVEYYLDQAPWESGAAPSALLATDGSFNGSTEGFTGSLNTAGLSEGKHMVYTRGRDSSGAWGAVSASFLVIDEDGGTPPLQYCTAASGSASAEWIGKVQVGGFSNTSGASTYSNFTGQTANLLRGNNSLTLTPQFSSTSYKEAWKVWIDLNRDGDFSDAGEQVFSSAAKTTPASGTLVIPASAASGTTRMRVAMRYNSAPSACGSYNYGEVEDYSVVIP